MIKEGPAAKRELKTVEIDSDLVVVGGGMGGVAPRPGQTTGTPGQPQVP